MPADQLWIIKRATNRLVLRVRAARAVYAAVWGLACGFALAGMIGLAGRLWPLLDRGQLWLTAVSLPLAAGILAFVGAFIWPVDRIRVLTAAEMKLGLRSRLSSALAFEGSQGGMIDRLWLDAARISRDIAWSAAVRFKFSRIAAGICAVAVLLLILNSVVPNPQFDVLRDKRQLAMEQREQAQRIRESAQHLNKLGSTDPEVRKILQELDALQQSLEKGNLTREEAVSRVAESEAKIQQLNIEGPARSRAALDRAASALGASALTSDLAQAIRDRDASRVKAELKSLDQKLRSGTPQEKQQIKQALQKAASETSGLSSDLSNALRQSAMDGKLSGSLEQQIDAGMSRASTADAVERTLSQLQDSRQSLAQSGDRNTAASSSGNQSSGGSTSDSNAQQGNASSGGGQGAKANSNQGSGQGSSGSSTTGGTGGGARTGVGQGNKSGQGGIAGGANRGTTPLPKDMPVYAPSRIDSKGKKLVRVGSSSSGNQEGTSVGQGARNQASRSYSEAYADYSQAAYSYLEDKYIPVSLKDYVREYFDQIAPSGEDSKSQGQGNK